MGIRVKFNIEFTRMPFERFGIQKRARCPRSDKDDKIGDAVSPVAKK